MCVCVAVSQGYRQHARLPRQCLSVAGFLRQSVCAEADYLTVQIVGFPLALVSRVMSLALPTYKAKKRYYLSILLITEENAKLCYKMISK